MPYHAIQFILFEGLHFLLSKVPLNLLAGFCLSISTYTSPFLGVLAPSRPIFWACHLSLGYSLPKLCKSCLRLQKPGEFLLILLSLTFLFLVSPIYIPFAILGGTCLSDAPSPSIECYPDDLGTVLLYNFCHCIILFAVLLGSSLSFLKSPSLWLLGTQYLAIWPCDPYLGMKILFASCQQLFHIHFMWWVLWKWWALVNGAANIADGWIYECCVLVPKSLCTRK